LIDKDQIPKNQVFFNPSRSKSIIYIRVTHHTSTEEKNHAILHNVETKSTVVVPCPYDKLQPHVNMFNGIEDFRICHFQGRLWFSGTTTHASDYMNNELIIGTFDPSLTSIDVLHVVDIGSRPVKNVCPFVVNDKLLFLDVYKSCIREILPVQHSSKKTTYHGVIFRDLIWTDPKWKDIQLRGSTSPVHLHGNTWGCIAHDIIFNDNSKLVTRLSYIHHWMEFDLERGHVTFVSSPFWVAHWGIEYISGIHYDESEKITLYAGVADQTCVQIVTTLHDLRVGK
jgi:hypothetical protein